jgi:protein TonB
MKLSTLQISVGLSLLTHGVIFSAFTFIQSGSGNSSQTGAAPISFVIISEPVSADANTSNPETIVDPRQTARSSSVLSSDEPIAPPAASEPVIPPRLPEVASENQGPEPAPSSNDNLLEEVSSSDSSAAEKSSALPNTISAPQASPPTRERGFPGASFGPAYLYNPAPRYPAKARAHNEQGTVTISVRLNSEGLPEEVAIHETSGFEALDRAALDAVRNWRFAAARRKSQPVETRVEIPIEFKLARTKGL